MYKITVIAALMIGLASYAQPNKGGNSEKGAKSDKTNHMGASPAKQDKAPKTEAHPKIAVTEQKGKEKGNGSKNEGGSHIQKTQQHGNQNKGATKSSNKSPKIVLQQQQKGKGQKGHDQKGNKPVHYTKSKNGNDHKSHSGKPMKINDGKHYSGKSQKVHYNKGYKGPIKHYTKGHPNFGYLYINTPGYYSHSNYGQWRSKEAKKKHKHYHPMYEYQAVEGFNFIIVRNNFLYTETHDKIILVRSGLVRQRNAGIITVVQYNNTMERVYALEQRRAALQINIEL